MSVEYKFLKGYIAHPGSGDSTSFTISIPETLIKDEDDTLLTIALNGQIIQNRLGSDPTTFAKYYYDVSKDTAAYVSDPTLSGVESSCSVTVTVVANQDFMTPGYVSGNHQVSTLSSSDVVYISFLYTVVRDA